MTENQAIAQEILRQCGARNLMGWGVRQRVAIENGVRFDISAFGKKKHFVEVVLNAMDTYDVKIVKVKRERIEGTRMTLPARVEVEEINDVYNDVLADVVESSFKKYCY